MVINKPYEPHPDIIVQDFEDRVQKGRYISHSKAGTSRAYSNLVLEKGNGVRFRVIALTKDIEDALAVARGEFFE